MSTDCFDGHIEDLAFECELTLPQARHVAELGLNASDPLVHHAALRSLADPAVANAYFEAFFGAFPTAAPQMLEAQVRRALASGHDNAGVHMAAAHVAEWSGDTGAWIDHLDTALRHDHTFAPARVDRAYAAWLQGDADSARRLVDGVDHLSAVLIDAALDLPEPIRLRVPRNRRCPCGSGAKSKHCCDGIFRLPEEHAWLLWLKLELWLGRFPQDMDLDDVAVELADGDHHDDDVVIEIRREGATGAIGLLDAGLIDRFVSTFGRLLPRDDVALLDQWREVRHRLWEIRHLDPGRHVDLVDVIDGEVRQTSDDGGSCCILPGELLFGPMLPTGTGGWFMPRHLPLDPVQGESIGERIRAGDRPMGVAVDVYRTLRDAHAG